MIYPGYKMIGIDGPFANSRQTPEELCAIRLNLIEQYRILMYVLQTHPDVPGGVGVWRFADSPAYLCWVIGEDTPRLDAPTIKRMWLDAYRWGAIASRIVEARTAVQDYWP